METFDNLAHQIVLLAINTRGGDLRKRSKLAAAAAAGALAELALQERLRLVDGKVQVFDERPTDDPLVDVMLRDLANRPDRAPVRIVGDARDAYLNQALGELVSNRWVHMTPASGLQSTRYEVVDTARLAAAQELATAGLRDPSSVSDRGACLAGLVAQIGLAKELVPEAPAWRRAALRQSFANRLWVNGAVRDVFSMSAQLDRI